MASIAVVIPAWNEEGSIGRVIDDLPKDLVGRVVVADNNSTDYTADVARKFGATVVPATRQGLRLGVSRGAGASRIPPARSAAADRRLHRRRLQRSSRATAAAGRSDPARRSRLRHRLAHAQAATERRPAAAGDLRQQAGVLPDPPAVPAALHRPRPVPRDHVGRACSDSTCATPTSAGPSRCRSRPRATSCASAKSPVDYRPRIGYSKITGTISGTSAPATRSS